MDLLNSALTKGSGMKPAYPKLGGIGAGLVAALWIIFFVMTAAAFGQSIGQVTINYIEASPVPAEGANRVRAYVTISDPEQNPIPDLGPDNFEALEDGRKISVEHVSQSADPMAVVLAIDTSGSMQAMDRSGKSSMQLAKRAAMEFISLLSPEDRVAIFSFNNKPVLRLDFSTDHNAAIDAVRSLRAKPRAATCLYDTAYQAIKKCAEIPKGRRAIILLTDGKDEKGGGVCSTYSSNDVIDAATTKTIRVPIYTVGAGPKVDAKELRRIAKLTGGRCLLGSSAAELSGFYQTLANQLKSQYLLTYLTRATSGEHSLVVKARYGPTSGQDEKRFWSPPLPMMPRPVVKILSPASGEEVQGRVTVRVSISPEEAVKKVRFYVGAALKEERTSPPFDSFVWETEGAPAGLQVVRVEAIDLNGQSGSDEITLKIKVPAPLPKPPTTVAEKKKGVQPVIWIGGLVALLIIIGMVAWLALRRKSEKPEEAWSPEEVVRPSEPKKAPAGFDADETQYIGDVGPAMEAMLSGGEEEPPIATLTVVKSMNLDPGKTFEITGNTTTVGRTSSNDIFIPDKPVSRKHAEIDHEGGVFYIRDLGSKNGTKLDGQMVSDEGAKLYDGAKIELSSKTILEFHILAPREEVFDDEATKIVGEEELPESDVTRVVEEEEITKVGAEGAVEEDEVTKVSEGEEIGEEDETKVYD